MRASEANSGLTNALRFMRAVERAGSSRGISVGSAGTRDVDAGAGSTGTTALARGALAGAGVSSAFSGAVEGGVEESSGCAVAWSGVGCGEASFAIGGFDAGVPSFAPTATADDSGGTGSSVVAAELAIDALVGASATNRSVRTEEILRGGTF